MFYSYLPLLLFLAAIKINDHCICPSKGHNSLITLKLWFLGLQKVRFNEVEDFKSPSIHLLGHNEIIGKLLKVRNVSNFLT